ncbi:MAG: hypothetical protein GF368_00940 [Candidatus Aenigmarchaeota archaeon]|nr:hypothetical protein [Candidatus Aenigmarchaeota archaeon]
MKTNSLFAFILTLLALVMVIGLFGYIGYRGLSKYLLRRPQYCEQFSVDLEPEMHSAELEVGKGKLIKVKITNKGFEDEFRIGFEGPEWIATRPVKVRLDQGETEEIFVYMSPGVDSEGSYTLMVFVESYCGREETEIRVTV